METPGVLLDADPALWAEHRFGLPKDRWNGLRGKGIWITGAGTGFGRSMAVALAAAGAIVFLTGRRPGKLEETREEMRSLGIDPTDSHAIPADITDETSLATAVDRITALNRGALYGLINNAACPPPQGGSWNVLDITKDQFSDLIHVDTLAQWSVSKMAMPLLTRSTSMRILFITSEAAWTFTCEVGAYNTAKAALNSLGGSLAKQCEERYPDLDIQINVLGPGEARTEMNQGSQTSPYTIASMVLALMSHTPGGPNGRFFHKDGRHYSFAYADPHPTPLF
jgi:NAD(P)-dependent dehydrogenase (short-subunit alcohol dehydrogenase family)